MRSRGALAVFLLALLLRGAILLALDGGPARDLEGDEKGYAAIAGSLARGEGFGFTIEGFSTGGVLVERRLLAFRAPLLPVVLAPVHALSGGSPAALRWACVVLGALAAPLAFGIAGRIGGTRASWIAGAAVALWPSNAWLSARVLSEPLDALLLLAAADFLLRKRSVLGGGVLGLAVLCRPGGLIAAVLAAGGAASAEERGRRLRPLVASLIAMAVVVVPWVARNHGIFGGAVLVTSGGVTVFGGNCDAALDADPPGKWIPPEAAWRGADAPDLGMYGWSTLDEGGSAARFAATAREWVADHPGRAALLALWKAVRFLDPDTHSRKEDSPLKSLAGWLSWGPALLLVVAALWAGRKLREPEWRIALALLLGHLAAALIAYGDARMRAPVEPALLALLVAPLLATGVSKWTAARDAAKVPA